MWAASLREIKQRLRSLSRNKSVLRGMSVCSWKACSAMTAAQDRLGECAGAEAGDPRPVAAAGDPRP